LSVSLGDLSCEGQAPQRKNPLRGGGTGENIKGEKNTDVRSRRLPGGLHKKHCRGEKKPTINNNAGRFSQGAAFPPVGAGGTLRKRVQRRAVSPREIMGALKSGYGNTWPHGKNTEGLRDRTGRFLRWFVPMKKEVGPKGGAGWDVTREIAAGTWHYLEGGGFRITERVNKIVIEGGRKKKI